MFFFFSFNIPKLNYVNLRRKIKCCSNVIFKILSTWHFQNSNCLLSSTFTLQFRRRLGRFCPVAGLVWPEADRSGRNFRKFGSIRFQFQQCKRSNLDQLGQKMGTIPRWESHHFDTGRRRKCCYSENWKGKKIGNGYGPVRQSCARKKMNRFWGGGKIWERRREGKQLSLGRDVRRSRDSIQFGIRFSSQHFKSNLIQLRKTTRKIISLLFFFKIAASEI